MTEHKLTDRALRRLRPGCSEDFYRANASPADELREPVPGVVERAGMAHGAQEAAVAVADDWRLVVTLALPPRILSPNRTVGSLGQRMAKSVAIKKYRRAAMDAAMRALATKDQPLLTTATVQVRWFSKTARRIDGDNLLASLKPGFDGIADAIFEDDRWITYLPVILLKDKENPRVEITILTTSACSDIEGHVK